jgi:uncharacterized protein YciI
VTTWSAIGGRLVTGAALMAIVLAAAAVSDVAKTTPAAYADSAATAAPPDTARGNDDLKPPIPMGRYLFGILRKGPNWSTERTAKTEQIQAGHMANIRRMSKSGLLVAAGPFLDNGDLRGLFVFRADSVKDVLPEVALDPSIS